MTPSLNHLARGRVEEEFVFRCLDSAVRVRGDTGEPPLGHPPVSALDFISH